MRRIILTLILAPILFLILASPAFAQGPGGDQFVFGSNLTLNAGETVQGDVVVFGGNVNVPESSTIDGDLVLIGGNARVDGTITGDIGVLGGNADLSETAVVQGDLNVIGGHISKAPEAVVGGQVENLDDPRRDDEDEPGRPLPPPVPSASNTSGSFLLFNRIINIFEQITWNVGLILGLALVGWLVASFLPEQMQTVGDTVAQATPLSFGMGLLTAVIAVVLALPLSLLVLTICLAIIPFAVYILLGIAILLGWLVIGQLIGERLLISTERPLPNLVASTVLGVIVLTVISNMPVVGVIPIIGPVFSFVGAIFGLLVALTGLGAVVLTRYGTRPYQPATSSFGSGSTSYRPYTPPPPPGGSGRVSPAEAELKAKIKAALAEADQANEPSGEKPTEAKNSTPEEPAVKKMPDDEEITEDKRPDPNPDQTDEDNPERKQ